jgi:uncharacterized membrane protein
MPTWTTAAPAVSAAFLSSIVEVVEALTIVLAVATVRGWRPASLGAVAGLVLLALIVVTFGPLLGLVPLHGLQFAVGLLLLLFGMRWLRKAILRGAGVIALHDETLAFAHETAGLREQAQRHEARLDWLAGLASFKAVVLEGLEVVFIVIAVGAGRGLVVPASFGALAAAALVLVAGLLIHRPRDAVGVRRLLGRRRPRRALAGRGSGDPSHRAHVSRERADRRARSAAACHGAGPMSAIVKVLRELIGLIVDDGRLALWTVAVVAAAAVVSCIPGVALAAGAILVFGCLTVLIASVMTAARR